MTTAIGPSVQQGVLSTQIDRVQNDKTVAEAARPESTPEPPPPPPPETGRGTEVDTSA